VSRGALEVSVANDVGPTVVEAINSPWSLAKLETSLLLIAVAMLMSRF